MARGKRTVRASEIGNYLFCQRAWWYTRQGVKSRNQAELAGGAAYHDRYAGEARRVVVYQFLGILLLITAFLFLIIFLASKTFS